MIARCDALMNDDGRKSYILHGQDKIDEMARMEDGYRKKGGGRRLQDTVR